MSGTSGVSKNLLNEQPGLFTWAKYGEHVQSNLKILLEDKIYSEVVFITKRDGKRIEAHRVILHMMSPYFKTMFASAFKESKETEIIIDDISGDILQIMIDFCYNGKILITDNNVEELLKSSHLMQFEMITNMCVEFMLKKMDPNNFLGIVTTFSLYNVTKISDKLNEFITMNFNKITKSDEYFNLNIDHLTEFLSRRNNNGIIEDDVLMALKAWVQHDSSNRQSYVPKLLELIKLPLLSKGCFWDQVVGWVGLKPPFDDIFADVFIYHLKEKPQTLTAPNPQLKLTIGPSNPPNSTLVISGNGEISIDIKPFNKPSKLLGKKYISGNIDFAMYAGRKILVVYSEKIMESYNIFRRRWTTLSYDTKLKASMVYCMGRVFSITGSKTTVYDIKTNYCQYNSQMTQMTKPRDDTGIQVLHDKIYVIGGQEKNNSYRSYRNRLPTPPIYLRNVEYYNPDEDTWTECPSLNVARAHIKVLFLKGYLYAIGGHNGNDCVEVERYKPGDDHWQLIAPLPLKGFAFKSYAYENGIYIEYSINGEKKWFKYNQGVNCWDHITPLWINCENIFVFPIYWNM